jgi:enamine deaminase RidA (YjgF/YER057c/UK114 family)
METPTTSTARSSGTGRRSTSEAEADSVRRAFSGAPWEPTYGYCRAVRVGDRIWVSGTAAVDPDGQVVAPGDLHAQTERCIQIVGEALSNLGAGLADVRRTRVFVTDIARWEEVARAHREAFGANPPAATMVEVSRLIDPDMLVEIEVDATVSHV